MYQGNESWGEIQKERNKQTKEKIQKQKEKQTKTKKYQIYAQPT
jgi:hypothetical protein